MKTGKLLKELERLGINTSNINIGGSVSYNDCFNLVQMQDGKWEFSYYENSQKIFQKIFDTEDDAAEYLLEQVKNQAQITDTKVKRKLLRPHKDTKPFQYYFILGFIILCALFGLFFVIIMPVTHSMNWTFWFFIGWTVFFAFLAFCWAKQKRYWKLEYIATPIIFTLFSLGCIAVMVIAFIYLWHEIACGADVVTNIIALVMAEASFGAFAWIFFHFFVQEYVERFIENLKESKKNKNKNQTKKNKKQ